MGEIMRLVEDDSLRSTAAGYEIKLRLLWYRSLPLSCIEKIQLSLDGQAVDPALISVGINRKQFKLDELPELVEEFWFIQDSALLCAAQPGRVVAGSQHQVSLQMAVRFPYIPIGPGKFLTRINQYSGLMLAA